MLTTDMLVLECKSTLQIASSLVDLVVDAGNTSSFTLLTLVILLTLGNILLYIKLLHTLMLRQCTTFVSQMVMSLHYIITMIDTGV